MNDIDHNNNADDTRKDSASSSLPEETAASAESEWFFAWLKSAGLYLAAVTAYLVTATGLVVAWKKYLAPEGDKPDFAIWALAGVLALPLLFALFFNLIPALRRRRERNLRPTGLGEAGYFTTGPRENDPHHLFDRGYEPFLEWAGAPKTPLLHLTGLSGSGKSSLIGAYLKPRLAQGDSQPKTMLLTVRSYDDPLAALKESLLVLWKKKPADYAELSPLEALRRAAKQLDGHERLLIVFDQFEEFFLLRAQATVKGQRDAEVASQPSPLVAEAELAPLREFLHAFINNPPERVAVLLSYRDDHRRLLEPLQLPGRQEGLNWKMIDPLDFAAAAAFLRSCPGLKIPEERMERLLREAARQEGGRIVMRPIVANLLGLIVQKMSGHPALWRRSGDLLRGYVKDCLGSELKEERGRVLRVLLTDFQTARPRSVADVSWETGLDAAALDGHLHHLGRAGLLRCVNASEAEPERRVWQISHDFLATLIERVLDGLHRTFWRTVRPWLAPAVVGVVIAVGVIWPWVEKHQAISFLANEGFTWNESNAAIVVGTKQGKSIENLDHLAASFRRLKPRKLDLSYCTALQNVDDLQRLTSLQSLDLSYCTALQNVDGLNGLTSLQSLNLHFCFSLQNVDGLKGLTSLQSLDLYACTVLQNVDDLQGLTSLQSLNLSLCRALKNVEGLKGLTALQSLDLSGCDALQNVAGLQGLTALHTLDLSNCYTLQNVDTLKGLTSLQSLNLSGCLSLPKESRHVLETSLSTTKITFPVYDPVRPE